MKNKNSLGYYRYKTYTVEDIMYLIAGLDLGYSEVLSMIEREGFDSSRGKKIKLNYKGDIFSLGGMRLQTFYQKGIKCSCGVEGKFFSLDNTSGKVEDSKHLNLIGVREVKGKQEEVLLTSDHIFPRSLGGSNKIENRQTMCANCNVKKGVSV